MAVHPERVGGTGQDRAVVATEIGYCGDGGREGMKDGGKQASHCWRRELHTGEGGKEGICGGAGVTGRAHDLSTRADRNGNAHVCVSARRRGSRGPRDRTPGALLREGADQAGFCPPKAPVAELPACLTKSSPQPCESGALRRSETSRDVSVPGRG